VTLFTAGILKLAAPSTPAATELAVDSWLIVLAAAETLLGLWLLIGWYPRPTRWAAVVAFSGLLGAALFMALRGDPSCNCFGEYSVNPWWMVVLDGSLVAALVAVPVEGTQSARWRPLAGCALALLGVGAGAYGRQAILAPAPAEGAVILTADSWEQSAQRIFEDADIGDQLRHGGWVIMLHRRGCPLCAETLERYRDLASEILLTAHRRRLALVEVSQGPAEISPDSSNDGLLLVGSLGRDRPWIVPTPFFLHARNGHVYRVDNQFPRVEQREATWASPDRLSPTGHGCPPHESGSRWAP
jgi:hypothetical protein